MFNKLLERVVLATLLCVSANSFAGMITDTVTQSVKVSNSIHDYFHDITDQGFVLGSALSGSLSIDIYDDSHDGLGNWKGEAATIIVENLDFDTGGLWGTLLFSAAPGWASELGVQALFALNESGVLDVKIKGLGDFWVGDSTLVVETADVPEPGTLALLGLGLAGFGLSRRKKA